MHALACCLLREVNERVLLGGVMQSVGHMRPTLKTVKDIVESSEDEMAWARVSVRNSSLLPLRVLRGRKRMHGWVSVHASAMTGVKTLEMSCSVRCHG